MHFAGADDIYDAAIRRAGMLRVFPTDELFDAVETLAHARPLAGDRLAIMTNGGGPGVMATDSLVLGEGHLAVLSSETLRKLDAILPPTWSRANPVDIAEFSHDCAKAKEVITNALAQGRTTLSEPEAKAILASYSIPVVDTRVVTTGEQAAQVAVELGFAVALEVLSPEVTHKSDVAGVTLDLENEVS